MKVLFYGSVREYANGEKSYELPEPAGGKGTASAACSLLPAESADCSSVRDLIGKLGDHFGERFKEFLFGNETCFFLINGKGIMMTGGLDTKLHPGDKIEVVPFAQGG